MGTPRPIQWNDWARPAYAGSPLYTKVDKVNTKGFNFRLPSIIPDELQRLGFEPLDVNDDPSKWGKLRQLEELGKGISFGGELLDELYRGNTKGDPDWKIGGMPDLPGIGGLKKTKTVIDAAKKARVAATAAKKAKEEAIKEVVEISRKPSPLAPASGVSAVSPIRPTGAIKPGRTKYVVRNGELVDVTPRDVFSSSIPDSMAMTEGPVKRNLLEPAAKATKRPSLAYVRQQVDSWNPLSNPYAPKQLPASAVSHYLPESGYLKDLKASIQNQVFPTGPRTRLLPETGTGRMPDLPEFPVSGGVRGPTDLPPIALDELYQAPKAFDSTNLPSLGRTPFFRGSQVQGSKVGEAENWWRSIENRLRADSPQGAAIADKYKAYRIEKGRIGGNWESQYDQIVKGVKGDDWKAVQESLESGVPLENPKLEGVRQRLVKLDEELVGAAKKHDLKLRNAKGETVPFTPHEKYWPHIYPETFWKDTKNVANALVDKYKIPFELALQTAERAAAHGGKLVLEPERLGKAFAKKFGPQMKSFQRSRELNLPGYRTDPDAYKIHIRDMADRVAAKQQFGDLDIAGKPGRDEFATLISQTKKPEDMKKLLTRVFERETEHPTGAARKLNELAMLGSTTKNLSMFALNNLQQLAALAAQNTPRSLLATAKSTFKRGERLKRGLESGALSPVHSDAISGMEGAQSKFSHYLNEAYGMSRGENFNRSLSAVAGQETAIDLFSRLKRGKVSDKIRNRIEELTLTPVNELMAQESLTKTQLDRAGGVMAAKTQGRAQSFDLPYHWTGGSSAPYKNTLTQFKKYPYVQSKLLIDALSQSPVQTAVAGTGAYLLGGEAIGAVKDAKRAAVDSIANGRDLDDAWDTQREARGEFTDPARYAKALTEGWMLGLPADVISDTLMGRAGGTFVPPVAEMLASGSNAIVNFGKNQLSGKKSKQKASRAAVLNYAKQWAPFIGRDWAAVTKKKKTGQLPSLPQVRLPEGW